MLVLGGAGVAEAAVDYVELVKRGQHVIVEDGDTYDQSSDSNIVCAIKLTEAADGDTGEAAQLTVNGGTLKGYYFGISGNGSRQNTVVTINGGLIEGIAENDGYGIFQPQNGTLNVHGGTIKGTNCGIEVRGGTVNIDGGNIISTRGTLHHQANGSGTTLGGAAIGISQHTTEKPIEVNISGGTFTGLYALYEEELQEEPTEITINITGGTFNGMIFSENVKDFIHGGTFSDETALNADYLAADANVTSTAANVSEFNTVAKDNQTVTFKPEETGSVVIVFQPHIDVGLPICIG